METAQVSLSVDRQDESVLAAVDRVQQGDVEAFVVIVDTYKNLVAAELARRLPTQDVAEIAQDVFVRAFRSLSFYRHHAPFRFWLLQITRNAANDFWRKHYRRKESLFTDLNEDSGHYVECVAQATASETQRAEDAKAGIREFLEAALACLTPQDRAVITLVELEEYPLEEAARMLGCGLSAIKVRAFRARQRLKKIVLKLRNQQEGIS